MSAEARVRDRCPHGFLRFGGQTLCRACGEAEHRPSYWWWLGFTSGFLLGGMAGFLFFAWLVWGRHS